MNASEPNSEATLFDLHSNEPKLAPSALEPTRESTPSAEVVTGGTEAAAQAVPSDERPSAASVAAAAVDDEVTSLEPAPEETSPITDRKRIEEQLDALKRKEFELRRALVVTDHPELTEAVRTFGARAFAVTQAESKLSQGLSKGELRRKEGIEKKLASFRAKRDELDAQIGALESELGGLGNERFTTFQAERRQAMEQLMIALGQHEQAIRSAGLEAIELVPDLERWLPELETIAQQVVSAQA